MYFPESEFHNFPGFRRTHRTGFSSGLPALGQVKYTPCGTHTGQPSEKMHAAHKGQMRGGVSSRSRIPAAGGHVVANGFV